MRRNGVVFILLIIISTSAWATAKSFSYNCKVKNEQGAQPDPTTINLTVSSDQATFSPNYDGKQKYNGTIRARDRAHLKDSNTALVYNFQDFDFNDASLAILGTKALIDPSLLEGKAGRIELRTFIFDEPAVAYGTYDCDKK